MQSRLAQMLAAGRHAVHRMNGKAAALSVDSHTAETAAVLPREEPFPPEFLPDVLRAYYPDLHHMTDGELAVHYETIGRDEGRCASPAQHRAEFLKCIPTNLRVLEIGPFSAPALRGPNISYVDIMTSEEIQAETIKRGEDPSSVPHIHFPKGLSSVTGAFDYMFSSHNVEHHPDLIGHLNAAADLLTADGVYCMIVPDKRYIFDQRFAETNIAEIIEAHMQPKPTHALRHVLEHYALTAHNEGAAHWAGEHRPSSTEETTHRLRHAMAAYQARPEHYFDVHAWKFTPASYRLIMQLLYELELTAFQPVRVYATPHNCIEFCAVLKKIPRE